MYAKFKKVMCLLNDKGAEHKQILKSTMHACVYQTRTPWEFKVHISPDKHERHTRQNAWQHDLIKLLQKTIQQNNT